MAKTELEVVRDALRPRPWTFYVLNGSCVFCIVVAAVVIFLFL